MQNRWIVLALFLLFIFFWLRTRQELNAAEERGNMYRDIARRLDEALTRQKNTTN